MPGALLQLVAVGSQDVHLIGNPKMDFFKSIPKSLVACIIIPHSGFLQLHTFLYSLIIASGW